MRGSKYHCFTLRTFCEPYLVSGSSFFQFSCTHKSVGWSVSGLHDTFLYHGELMVKLNLEHFSKALTAVWPETSIFRGNDSEPPPQTSESLSRSFTQIGWCTSFSKKHLWPRGWLEKKRIFVESSLPLSLHSHMSVSCLCTCGVAAVFFVVFLRECSWSVYHSLHLCWKNTTDGRIQGPKLSEKQWRVWRLRCWTCFDLVMNI